MSHVPLDAYLAIGAALFAFGVFDVVTHRTPLGALPGVALVAAAAALDFVAFDHFGGDVTGAGRIAALFVVLLSAPASAIVVAIAVAFERTRAARDRRGAVPEARR